jgi:hypothetical protein
VDINIKRVWVLKNPRREIALSSAMVMACISLPMPVKAQTAIPAPVSSCASNPACLVSIAVLSGVMYWVTTENGQTRYYNFSEYLENPEGESR